MMSRIPSDYYRMTTNGYMDHDSKKIKLDHVDSELEQFDDVFTELVDFLTKTCLRGEEISDAVHWFKQVAEYNVPFGKKNRGISVISSYKALVPDYLESDLKLARVLGWCVEWLQAFFLVADDIMDASTTRRGKPCWYKKDGVGLTAINDSYFLEACVYAILKKYIRDKPYYVNVMELFHETSLQTVIGQCLDLITAPVDGTVDFTKFTMERYSAIVKWKTAYYSFYLPVALAMIMAGITDAEAHSNAQTILLKMGHFFQVQDDYLDCFGDPKVLGKVGTDIEENKCSWLVVTALSLVNEEQEQVLKNNYGHRQPDKVACVKALYKKLDLPKVYRDYEETSYKELKVLISSFRGSLPEKIFSDFAQKIYKREK